MVAGSSGRVLASCLTLGLGSCVAPTTSEAPPDEPPAASSGPSLPAGTTAPEDDGTSTSPAVDSGDPGRDDASPPPPPLDLGPPEPPPEPPAGFVDVTDEAGLLLDSGPFNIAPWCLVDDVRTPAQTGDYCIPERFLGAAAAADVDGDGWPDLYLTTLAGPDRFLRNRGDGTFEDVTAAAGLAEPHATGAAAWLDVEGDGDLDLLLTTVGELRNLLYVNDGTGWFEEQGVARGVAVQTGSVHVGMGIGVGDYDLDGWLDVYVADWHPDDALGDEVDHNRLLHGLGASAPGSFEDVTAAMGLDLRAVAPLVDAKPGSYGFAPAFVDLDDDGWPELSLAADFGTSRLWWNEGGQALIDLTVVGGVGTERNGMGSTFGDIDGDGDLDWFVTAISAARFPELGNRLYRNDGSLDFTDVTDDYDVRNGGWGWGTALFDADLDGDLDLAMAAGWPSMLHQGETPTLWIADGAGPWTTRPLDPDPDHTGRGLLPWDYDRDGDLDLLLVNNAEPPTLLRNDLATGHWLVVEAIGGAGNSRSLGAVVRVQAEPDGAWQVRHIGVGSHLFGQGEAVAHFGLGEHDTPLHRVEITWPAMGTQWVGQDVPPDQWLVVPQP